MEKRNPGGLGTSMAVTKVVRGGRHTAAAVVRGTLPAVTEFSWPVGTESCFC